jgi:quercetin dioxygenase-like cupin family protein
MVARVELAIASAADFAELRRRFAGLPLRPKLVQGREAGTDISSPGRQSLTLLIGEETAGALYATDVYLSPGFGAPSHHQPTEDELWYLLEGELDVRVGAQRAKIRAGAFAYIPRDTTHAFRNNGAAPARLLAWNSPGGHERAFEEMGRLARQGVTAFPDLRDMFQRHGVELHPDESQSARNDYSAGPKLVAAPAPGAGTRRLLGAEESRGEYEVTDLRIEGGEGLERCEEASELCLFVLEGSVRLTVGDEAQEARRGAFAFVPRRTMLRVANPGPARLLMWRTPAR